MNTPTKAIESREFRLVLRDVGESDSRFRRLRGCLKAMLRSWGFRVVLCEPSAGKDAAEDPT
jgi:hypothetical protein